MLLLCLYRYDDRTARKIEKVWAAYAESALGCRMRWALLGLDGISPSRFGIAVRPLDEMFEHAMEFSNYVNHDIVSLLQRQSGELCVPGTSTQINNVEKRLRHTLPAPMKEWLKICNGSLGGQGGILGIDQANSFIDLEARLSLYPNWIGLNWTPVATDGCGNHYVLVHDSKVSGCFPVCFIDNAEDPDVLAYAVASRLELFLRFMLWREMGIIDAWPFNKDWMLEHDPDIANVSVAPAPWDLDE